MGTWGITAFEDDTALAYYDEFCESEQSVDELRAGIDEVLFKDYNMQDLLMEGFLEPLKALVYCEIIAKVCGNSIDEFPDDEYHENMELSKIDMYAISNQLNETLIQKAIDVVHKIKQDKNMHLTVLWFESDYFNDWQKYLENLIVRLRCDTLL